ncbi:MAG: glycosyltransferase [Spirochaetaceae bacterium]|jgi:glycosyltransferase involved in cell wall biosynthesis|nr:glycosyltransferase [Spirochaetaceae bacterium]
MKEPAVSIIVPVYNCAEFLPKCLGSLAEQTEENVQVILVDDGSTDRSPAICDEYAGKHPEFEVIHKKNGGVSAARNDGISAARGAYIMFLDGDDYLSADTTKDLLRSIRENKSDIATITSSVTVVIDESPLNSIMSNRPIKFNDGVYSALDICREYLEREPLLTSVVWGKLYKRELFEGLRFTSGKGFEDTLLLPSVYLRAKTVSCINGDYYYYVQRASSVMHSSYSPKKYSDFLDSRIFKITAFYNGGLKDANWTFERRLFEVYLTYFKEYLKHLNEAQRSAAAAEYEKRLNWYGAQEWFVRGGKTRLVLHSGDEY